jgi:oligoendopeptidase F
LNFKRKSLLTLELHRDENIPLEVEQTNLSQAYASIVGGLVVQHQGKELTVQQASAYLRNPDRDLRREIYLKISEERHGVKGKIDDILDKQIALRHQQAINAGFDNYRDYKHRALGRFDYTVADVKTFHQTVEEIALPVQEKLLALRKEKLGLSTLHPYDLQVNTHSNKPLKPFDLGDELLAKSIACFEKIDPLFKETLESMAGLGFLDLDSRKGKAPGGYNYPLDEHGVPFIFMNATGNMRDVTTMVHEGGHAVHSILCRNLGVNQLKHCPSEVAELASMSMELISMDGWDTYFSDESDLLRAKIEQLESTLDVLPWIATVDCFQHWLYTHPAHGRQERDDAWVDIYDRFNSPLVDFKDFDKYKRNMWQKQLHIIEVPFYYIEYGIAQLGAIAVWRNYKDDPIKGLKRYKEALSLGYTKSIPDIYKAAGISFDFSPDYVKGLLDFVWSELERLNQAYQQLVSDTVPS